MPDTSIAENLRWVQKRIQQACQRVGRDPGSVHLIAISKRHPIASIAEAYDAGIRHFGENRVEEVAVKWRDMPEYLRHECAWHMVGHLQSRKAGAATAIFHAVHSLDSVKLAYKLASSVSQAGAVPMDVFLEMNVSGEESKQGFFVQGWDSDPALFEQIRAFAEEVAGLPSLRIRGLMTMAPYVGETVVIRQVFRSLRRLRDALSDSLEIPMPDLSMGMTNDFEIAIEEGSTFVRIGTAIFGARD